MPESCLQLFFFWYKCLHPLHPLLPTLCYEKNSLTPLHGSPPQLDSLAIWNKWCSLARPRSQNEQHLPRRVILTLRKRTILLKRIHDHWGYISSKNFAPGQVGWWEKDQRVWRMDRLSCARSTAFTNFSPQSFETKRTKQCYCQGFIFQQSPLNWWRSDEAGPFKAICPDRPMHSTHFHHITGWELWYINYIEENKSTYSYVCQKFAWLSVSIYLANRIVLVVTGHIPKADASINRAVHAVLVQTPIWLGLPPHKVSNRTKRVHPEPVTLPVNASFCANNICQ